MIADEVAVGFGRTGKMFACDHEGVVPDIMALAKGISGGYLPLAATLVNEKIYEGFLGKYEEFKTFFHGHTYTGNHLACAVSLANLEIFEEEHVIDKLQGKIEHLTKKLQSLDARWRETAQTPPRSACAAGRDRRFPSAPTIARSRALQRNARQRRAENAW